MVEQIRVSVIPKEGVESNPERPKTVCRVLLDVIPKEGVESMAIGSVTFLGNLLSLQVIPKEGVERNPLNFRLGGLAGRA